MEPARWDQIEELLQAALDREPDQRAAFLTAACGSDADLRREVEQLLAGESEAGFLSQSPALALIDRSGERLVGQTISHYRLTAKIGAGGMGDVYEAHDQNLQRIVALKVLPEEFTSEAERVRRFEQEAFAASRLNHPNIITIFEILQCDGAHFIATERIDGETLRGLLKASRKLDLEKAIDVAIQVAGALKAAHTAWIIHRDIKPENIMVRSDGLVKVLDFGIAKLNESREDKGDSVAPAAGRPSSVGNGEPPASGQRDEIFTTSSEDQLTAAGAILGTANYMSPEQARGEPLDGRTDLYSLGLVLHEMVTGERDVQSRAPKEIQPIVRKLLRSDRDERYSSAGELLDDLHRVKRRRESRSARRMVGVGVLAVIVAIAVAAIAAFLSVNEVWAERVLRDGHTAAARQAVFSPDGRMLVSCGEDGQVIVWDFARRERLAELSHPSHKIAWSPDGRWVATGGIDGSIVIWDTKRWTKLQMLRGHWKEITALAFSQDATRLASADPVDAILWDTGRWQKMRDWPDGGTNHGTFIFSPDLRYLFYTTNVTVFDLERGGKQVADNPVGANWLALSPDSTQLASISPHGQVSFFRFDDKSDRRLELITRHRAHQDHGRSIAWSPDGNLIASAAETILLWDAATRRKVARFEYTSIVWSVAFSPDGRWLLSTHGDGAVLVWDVAERVCVASLNEHSGGVRAVAFSRDGSRVASGGEDRMVTLWELQNGRKEAVLAAHETRVTGVAFSTDGRRLASADQDGVIVFWDVANRRPRSTIEPAVKGATYCLQFSPDDRFLVTTRGLLTADGRVVRDVTRRPHFGQVYGADFSRDGRWVATASDAGCVSIWDGRDFRLIEQRRVPNTHQISVSVSNDGKWLVTGEDEGAVRLWSTSPLRQVAILGRHAARVKSVAFSPDGSTVASAGDDKMIALWDVKRRKLKSRIGTHASPIYAVAFSPDGTRLVSGEHDRSVRVYTRERSLWGFPLD